MKNKIILLLLLCLSHFACYSQNPETKRKAEKNTKEPKKVLVCSNNDNTKWFAIQLFFERNTEANVVYTLKVVKSNIGTSNGAEKDLIIFKFKDDTFVRLKAKSGLLEDSTIEFSLSNKDLYALLTKSVVSIRYINGTDYNSMNYPTVGNENSFFYNSLRF